MTRSSGQRDKRKLYLVTVEVELMVLADDRRDAKAIAQRAMQRDVDIELDDIDAGPAYRLAREWDPDCFPFIARDEGNEKSVGELMETLERGVEEEDEDEDEDEEDDED